MIVKVTMAPQGPQGHLEEKEVTDWLLSVSRVENSVDNSDFVVGVFSFGNVKIKLHNGNGQFSEDGRFFPFQRNLSLVKIFLSRDDQDFLVFNGLISDDATKEDDENDSIYFTVLSLDSVMSTKSMPFGVITDGMTFEEAIGNIFRIGAIKQSLSLQEKNLNLDFTGTIQSAEPFTGISVSEALNELLVVSNSVATVNLDGEVSIQSRTQERPLIKVFKGPFSEVRTGNEIVKVKNINNGYHRMINSVKIGPNIYSDQTYIDAFKLREKSLDTEFLSVSQAASVARNLIAKFRYPKREMTITVPILEAYELNILDLVAVDYEKRLASKTGRFARYDIDSYDEAGYPDELGALTVSPQIGWIVYEISHDLQNFVTSLKLREFGIDSGDSVILDFPNEYDLAVYGEAEYAEEAS